MTFGPLIHPVERQTAQAARLAVGIGELGAVINGIVAVVDGLDVFDTVEGTVAAGLDARTLLVIVSAVLRELPLPS